MTIYTPTDEECLEYFNPNYVPPSLDEMMEGASLNSYYKYATFLGKTHTDETKEKLSAIAKTKTGNKNPFYGKSHSLETKEKISRSNSGRKSHLPMLGKKHSEETKAKISAGGSGLKRSQETKDKIRKARMGKPRPKATCPHCNKIGATGLMNRWHFDNCKSKS